LKKRKKKKKKKKKTFITYVCLLWFWGPGLRMLCVRSMRNTEARPDCSQPASHPGLHSPALHTHTPPFPPPQNRNRDCQNIGRKCFQGRVYLRSTGTTCLAGSDICMCVCVWARMWCAVAAEPIVCSERARNE